LIALIIIFAGGWVLMFMANVVAFIASPQMIAKFECPAGTTIQGEYVNSADSTESIYTYECLDQNGNAVPTNSPDEVTAAEYKFFYPPSVAFMALLVIGWFAWSALRKRSSAA
jgi:hypothetical protein